MQVMLLSMMEKLSELRSKFEGEAFKLFIGGSTAGNACSMQMYKFEKNIFKLLIGGSTASGACSMQGDKKWKIILRKIMML